MKIKTILFSLLFIVAISSCNQSEKGAWSEADIEKFHKELDGVDLGDYDDKKEEWMECYLSKAQANYSSFAEADSDMDGCKKMAKECMEEVLASSSAKGQWSNDDKKRFYDAMKQVDLSDLGELKEVWIECYLGKAEQNYASFFEADSDPAGCEKIALECQDEILAEMEFSDETENGNPIE